MRAKKTTHGKSETGAYKSWLRMRQRCLNPKSTQYRHYGKRGITICSRWESFENFHADMGDRPEGMSLDRIDPNGNYEPGNCRWADQTTQARNIRAGIGRGITATKSGKFTASIAIGHKNHHIGTFDTFNDAVAGRLLAQFIFWH